MKRKFYDNPISFLFQAMLNFIYTGKIGSEILRYHAVELLKAADLYQLNGLKGEY